jgi:hypothetical protein
LRIATLERAPQQNTLAASLLLNFDVAFGH